MTSWCARAINHCEEFTQRYQLCEVHALKRSWETDLEGISVRNWLKWQTGNMLLLRYLKRDSWFFNTSWCFININSFNHSCKPFVQCAGMTLVQCLFLRFWGFRVPQGHQWVIFAGCSGESLSPDTLQYPWGSLRKNPLIPNQSP